MPEAILFLHDVASQHAVGGKARGLAKLTAAGFSIPEGFVAMPDAQNDEIVAAYRILGAGPVAVRSSAEEEDAETRSYAGQFDTFLNVSGEAHVAEAVKACRASASNPRVASYRDDDAAPVQIPVIVQRMVRPDYAGVAFASPDGPTLVEAVPGLADRLVSGQASPSPLPEHVRERVERVSREVVGRFGSGQDIEWAAEGDRMWLLQVRAVTAPLPAVLPDRFPLWTAANVQEAIPRPLTPLSEELTLANMSRIFEASYAFAGLPPPADAHVRFVNGRVYMSYSAMASAMSAMPGFRIETLLLMFGDSPKLAPSIAYRPGGRRYFLFRLPATLVRSVAWLLFAERYIERAREVADRFEQHVRSTLAGDPTDAQLLELFRSVQTSDSTPIDAMSVSTSMANRLLGTLMSTRAATDHTSRVDAAALAVTGDSESLEPARQLAALAEWLRANPGLPDGSPEVQARLAEFMEICGFRCEEEAELANPRWVEQPDAVLGLAAQLASAPAASLSAVAQPARPALRLGRPRLRVLVAQARTWQRRRERTRAILSRAGMSVRLLLLAIGRRLCDRKLLNAPDEVCFLLRDEIVSLLDASALETARAEQLVGRIAPRRARYRRLLAWPPSSRLLAELPDGRLVPFAPEPNGDALRGCGASPGRATGRARVVREFGEIHTLEPGEILVTRTTDIGWTPLFRLASAVVTEIGAPTSHAAIVARELGLPAVVNVDRVTERVCTGDVLFVDGWAGVVRRVDQAVHPRVSGEQRHVRPSRRELLSRSAMIDREGRAGTVDSRQPGDCAAPAHAAPRAAVEAMILPLDDEVSLEAGGGKAANLARLVRAGFAVPSGFVITTRAYRDFVSANDLEDWTLDTAHAARSEEPASLDAASTAIRTRFASATMPLEVVDATCAAYAALGGPPVAVRSSATTEDLPDLSFAGQQDTMLNVIGEAALMRAVVQCWSSLWTARAIGYRARNGIAHDGAALAVVVQQMVASEASGVMFTANPLTGKRSETVIDATLGLGEAFVSGRVEPDHYVIDPLAGHVLERRIGAKALSVRACAQGGTAEVQEDATGRAALTDAAALELASLGRRVAMLFGTPQDIEWAQAIGRYSLLQARPITSLFPLPETLPTDGLHVLISFGAVQGMLDPITPLGRGLFSVLPRALAPLPLGHPFVVAGERLFFDITRAVRNPRLRPHMRRALRAIEPATGEVLDEVLADAASMPAATPHRWRVPSARLLALLTRALGNLTYNLLWPHRGRARVQRRLSAAIAAFERRSAVAHSLAERVALLEQAFPQWMVRTGVPLMLPGMGAGLASLRLLHVLAADLPDGQRRVLELTRGLPHNVTTEMDLALWDVARIIRGDKDAADFFSASDASRLARDSMARRLPPVAQTAIDAFLQRYGMRGVGEIDLGRPRWRDDPTTLMQALQSYLQIEEGEQAPDVVFRRGAEAAERALASLTADARRTRFGWLKAFVMTRSARRMRALAGLRESPKFTVMAMLGAVRVGLLASGHELAARGILDSANDIFFLQLDELKSLAAGEPRDWRSAVQERRRAYAREARRRRVPRLLLTDGRAFFGGTGGEPVAGSTLVGAPVSPGVVVGLVRVVLDPRGAQLTPGEILVCRGTDPAWTPLFLAAAGLVTEVGGLMTHGSVVAREYGIPAVVGVHDATTRLRTGARVHVDGTNGRITVLDA